MKIASVVLGVGLVLAACSTHGPSADQKPRHRPEKRSLVYDAAVVNKLLTPELCKEVDSAMLLTAEPSVYLRAMDAACRAARVNGPGKSNKVPVIVAKDDKVFFGLVPRELLAKANESCLAAAPLLANIIPGMEAPSSVVTAATTATCETLHAEMEKDNPIVIISGTTLIANQLLKDAAQSVKGIPVLSETAAALQKINQVMVDGVEHAARTVIEEAKKDPKKALLILQSQFDLLDPVKARQHAESVVGVLLGNGIPIEGLRNTATQIGGPFGGLISQIIQSVPIPGSPPPVPIQVPASIPRVVRCVVNPLGCVGG